MKWRVLRQFSLKFLSIVNIPGLIKIIKDSFIYNLYVKTDVFILSVSKQQLYEILSLYPLIPRSK